MELLLLLIFQFHQNYFLRINSVSTCYKIIGLVLGVNYNANSNVLTCVYPLNLLGIKKLKIYVNELSSSNLDSSNFYKY